MTEVSRRPLAERWSIPRRVWLILASWGMGASLIAILLSAWIWTNQRESERARDRLALKQDHAMCAMIDLLTSGPAPVPGPAGDRGRAVLRAMTDYRATLRCGG